MKFIKFLLSAIIITPCFIGCQKSADNAFIQKAEKIELTPNTFDFVGQSHNDGLDYVFDNTFKNNINSKYNDVKNASVKYVFDVNESTKYSKDDKSLFAAQEFKELIKKATSASSINLNESGLKHSLTEKQLQFINLLNIDLTKTSHTYDVIIRNIEGLEKSAIKELGKNEIVYVLCVSSVAKHSIEDWNTSKGEKWFKKFNKPFQPIGTFNSNNLAAKIDWHNVAVADVLGFGTGFPSGVTVGMVAGGLAVGVATGGAGAGIGAVLGGLVGGTATGLAAAVTASAATLAAEWVVSWFD